MVRGTGCDLVDAVHEVDEDEVVEGDAAVEVGQVREAVPVVYQNK